MPDMNSVSMMERTFSMQLDFLKAIRSLIAYDKEHSQEPEKTRFLGSVKILSQIHFIRQ